MYWIIFVPRDASKSIPFFGPRIGLIIMIVWVPGGKKQKYNFKNNHARKTNVRRQIYFLWILFVYKAHLSFRQPIRTFFSHLSSPSAFTGDKQQNPKSVF